ncbi:hypothetical protein ACFFRR_003931 [Megaselia abdita]
MITIRNSSKLCFVIGVLYLTINLCQRLTEPYHNYESEIAETPKPKNEHSELIDCYKVGRPVPQDGWRLPDVLKSERKPRPGKTIFFHETSCPVNGLLEIGKRQVCSIESAAKNNPNLDIFVLFTSPRYISPDVLSTEIWRLKLTYKNIFLRNNDMWEYTKNSSAVDFMESGGLFDSKFLPVHMSDFLRLLSIWKYGGIYMDTDIIVKRTFENLPLNYGGIEEHGVDLNNGLLSLAPNGNGHEIGDLFIKDFAKNFKPKSWATNGPMLITRVLRKVCNATDLREIPTERCRGFKVYSREMFWAVSYIKANSFFNESELNNLMQQTRNSYSIHVFNHMTKGLKQKIGAKTLYGVMSEEHCPITYSNADGFL